MDGWNVRRVTAADAGRMRALRLEMLADSPLAFLETLAQAAARSHEGYRQRIAQSATGRQVAQFIADPGGRSRLIGHAGGTIAPESPAAPAGSAMAEQTARAAAVTPRTVDRVMRAGRRMGSPLIRLGGTRLRRDAADSCSPVRVGANVRPGAQPDV